MSGKKLFSHRLIFMMGKGGAGKSTLCASLAIAAASTNKRVLLVETGENDSLGHIFERGTLGHKPERLRENIRGARIDPKKVLEEYVQKYVATSYIADRITKSTVFDHFAAATPGLKEVMSLAQIWRWEKKNTKDNQPLYDLIIVDAPATGHGTSFLQVPSTLLSMLRAGPIATQTGWVMELLRDKDKTCIAMVTLAEELPVNETLEFQRGIENDLDMSVVLTFANMIFPRVFTSSQAEDIEKLERRWETKMPGDMEPLLAAARSQIERRNFQQGYVQRLRAEGECPVVEIPFFFTNRLSASQLERLGSRLKDMV